MKHKVETEVLKRKPLFCFGCGKSPLMGSADGNRKLYRYKSSGLVKKTQNEVDELIAIHEYFGMDHRMTFFLVYFRANSRSRYNDEAFFSRETALAHRSLITSKIPGVLS